MRAWLAFLTARPRLTATVAGSGLVAAAAVSATPYLFDRFSRALSAGEDAASWAALLVGASVLSAVAGWTKEGAELRLVVAVRFLALRTFFEESLDDSSGRRAPSTGRFSTHPAQISQFAYVVDLAITLVRSVAIATFVVLTYGAVGWTALVGVCVATLMALRLVHLVGAVYHRYIESEAARVDHIRDLSNAAWKLRAAGLSEHVAGWMQSRRDAQVPVLLRRANLQVVNGIVASAAVPVVVTTAALVFVLRADGGASTLVPLLVAAGLLSSALQEAVTNYRVVRLTIPMLQAWDERRLAPRADVDLDVLRGIDQTPGVTWLSVSDEAAEAAASDLVRAAGRIHGWGWLSSDPRVDGRVVQTWAGSLDAGTRQELDSWLVALELPSDLDVADAVERLASMSRGERHRLALAVALTVSAGPCVLSQPTLAAIDHASRHRLVGRIVDAGRRVVLVAEDCLGVPVDQQIALTLRDGVLVGEPVVRTLEHVPDGHEPVAPVPVPVRTAEAAVEDPGFATPRPTVGSAARAVLIVLGAGGTALLCAAVVVASTLGVVLPIVLGGTRSDGDRRQAAILLVLLVATLVVTLGVNLLQHRTPVGRLTELHARIADRLAWIAGPSRTGELVGRFGEDFSSIQMQVPAQLVGALVVTTQLVGVVLTLALGEPAIVLVIAVLVPLAFVLYRSGERRIVTAVGEQSRARGTFMAFSTGALDDDSAGSHPQLRAAVLATYGVEEDRFGRASEGLVSAMMRRRTELQTAGLVIFGAGTALALEADRVSSAIAPAVIAYLVYTIANQLPQLVESVQSISVSAATAARVTSLLDAPDSVPPPVPLVGRTVAMLEAAVEQGGGRLLHVSGRTGVGKSIALRSVTARRGSAAIFLEDDLPVRTVAVADVCEAVGAAAPGADPARPVGDLSLADRQRLLVAHAQASGVELAVLDESLSALSSGEAERVLEDLRSRARATGRTFVVVSHTSTDASPVDERVAVEA